MTYTTSGWQIGESVTTANTFTCTGTWTGHPYVRPVTDTLSSVVSDWIGRAADNSGDIGWGVRDEPIYGRGWPGLIAEEFVLRPSLDGEYYIIKKKEEKEIKEEKLSPPKELLRLLGAEGEEKEETECVWF